MFIPHAVGFIHDGVLYCYVCAQKANLLRLAETSAFPEWEEFDSPPHCEECGEHIGGALTRHGYADLCRRMREGMTEDLLRVYLDAYEHSYDGFKIIPTFFGMVDPLGNR